LYAKVVYTLSLGSICHSFASIMQGSRMSTSCIENGNVEGSCIMSANPLERELATYERHKAELLAQEGRFVLIQADDVVGVYDTYNDALEEGYKRFGLDHPFLIKQVRDVEEVQFFTRYITPCLP
jgi:hypothetical protein